jgi:hypothetical protein
MGDGLVNAFKEFERLEAAYRSGGRLAECPDDDATCMERIEVDFAIPVLMTQDQQRRLLEIIDEIADSPWNTPAEGVHWMAGMGSKMHWSKIDALMLGKTPDPDAPATGEPARDDSVYHVETCARAFGSERERAKVKARPKYANASPDAGRGGPGEEG